MKSIIELIVVTAVATVSAAAITGCQVSALSNETADIEKSDDSITVPGTVTESEYEMCFI